MRQLARFEERDRAEILADTLYVEGIEGRVEEARDGAFILWVEDERHLDRAKELLSLFEEEPGDARFEKARKEAESRRKNAAKKEAAAQKRADKLRARLERRTESGYGRVTLGLIFTCVGLALAMQFTNYQAIYRWLAYAGPTPFGLPWGGIRDGQVWRLVTPAFVHAPIMGFGVLHLFFNMYWLKDLGTLYERNTSGLRLLLFVLVVAALSNTFAFFVWGEQSFVGMSGVILGLWGYAWARFKIGKSHEWAMPQSWALWLIGFYLVALFGLLGGVANGVHTGGLLAGAAWGAIAGLRERAGSRRP